MLHYTSFVIMHTVTYIHMQFNGNLNISAENYTYAA